ncbi:MAG: Hsp33 family molecular chaperone HslO, partial [Sulfuricella sp.]|nr:Hsp33 family molecular chaperone HslO [Sulfuricella sp.]
MQRFVFEHAAVRGEIVRLDATWKAVLERRDYPPALRTVLGELMAAAALLSATLKFSGSLIMQIQGGGPVRLLIVECGADLTMRAMAHWDGDLAEGAALPELVGEGRFVITIDPKKGRQTYQGIVGLEGGSVAAVLENYMQRSEQLDTRIWLAADSHGAAGLLLQKMPDGPEADTDAWNRAALLGTTVKPRELLDLPAREIIHRLFHEEDIRLFDSGPVHFGCTCSRERVANTLRMLGY